MKNRLQSLFLFCICITLLGACEENKDGFYDRTPRIYFTVDSLNFSFGDKVSEIDRQIIYYPVKMLGLKATREMKFKVVVDPKKSTAIEGTHFTVMAADYPLLQDSVNAYIPIELLRKDLSEEEVSYRIALRLEASEDFQTGILEAQTAVLTFNNYLQEPSWWAGTMSTYALNYKPGMYQRLIAYYGAPLEEKYVSNHYIELMTVFKIEVYDYAQKHPELGWEFNSDLWWPFV